MKSIVNAHKPHGKLKITTLLAICLSVFSLLPFSAKVEAQGLPQECQQIDDQIARLESEKERFSERLRGASPSQKSILLARIRNLNSRIDEKKSELADCRRRHGLPVRPLTATFVGTATLRTTNSYAPGPYNQRVTIGLMFGMDRSIVWITRFPRIRVSYDTPLGDATTTVTQSGGGRGSLNLASGVISMAVTLHFHHSSAFAGDSDIEFTLTTGRSRLRNGKFDVTGSPLSTDGSITVVGVAKFRDGFLDGNECSVVITGTVSPNPIATE
jgi:hypothetical protein